MSTPAASQSRESLTRMLSFKLRGQDNLIGNAIVSPPGPVMDADPGYVHGDAGSELQQMDSGFGLPFGIERSAIFAPSVAAAAQATEVNAQNELATTRRDRLATCISFFNSKIGMTSKGRLEDLETDSAGIDSAVPARRSKILASSSSISACDCAGDPMAQSSYGRDATQHLPTELLSSTLELLQQPALLAAAHVSRCWRAIATRLPNFYRHHFFAFPEPNERPWQFSFSDDIEVFDRVVREADALNLKLSLRINATTDGPDDSDSESDWDDDLRSSPRPPRMKTSLLFPVLRRAARLLVSLSIRVIASDADALLESISVPAPFLRTLRLSGSDHTKEAIPWPAELFGGAAPRLTSVNVDNVAFPPSTPAFLAVGDLTVAYGRNNQCLGQLTVMVPAFDAIRRIRAIEFGGWEAVSTLPQFMRHCGPVQLVVEEHDRPHLWGNRDRKDHTRYSQLRISLAFTHHEDVCGPAHRVFDCDISHVDSFQLLASFGVAPNLTAVTIDDRQLRTFMDKLGILPALVTLSVVLVVWADTPPGAWDIHFTCEYCTKKSCSCYGYSGYFSDNLDDRWPSDACTPPVFPALRTLALHAARAGSSISAEVLLALARALAPQGDRLLDLELWRGLRADMDAAAPAFRSVASFGEFDPASHTAARVEALRCRAGKRKGNIRMNTIIQRESVRSDCAVREYTGA
ncbi:hypothetical protein AURDEDRAFT_151321 [Auricularia subglabra TFB-10046 SS5]|nr:hypothetical protein AURDEDRAFT_151321 [Auricularia subglabra TFB-10046 SS5]